jgi:hypothetical protein
MVEIFIFIDLFIYWYPAFDICYRYFFIFFEKKEAAFLAASDIELLNFE